MSSDMLSLSDRTRVCAADSEHGLVVVHAVPVPVGEAYRVVTAARATGADASATNAMTDVISAATRAMVDANTGSPHLERIRRTPPPRRRCTRGEFIIRMTYSQ